MNQTGLEGEQWYPRLPEGFTGEIEKGGQPQMNQWSVNMQPTAFPYDYGQMNHFAYQPQPSYEYDWTTGFIQPWRPMPSQPYQPPAPNFPNTPGWSPSGGFPPVNPSNPSGGQPPMTPPPQYTPSYPSQQLYAVDPGGIRRCLYRMTYIWLSRTNGFWFYPVFVGRTSVAGYRWRRRTRSWEYFGIDLDRIEAFTC